MADTFKVGETVQLKSGGPPMTVTVAGSAKSHVTCKWFAGKKLEWGQFPPDALRYPPAEDDKQ